MHAAGLQLHSHLPGSFATAERWHPPCRSGEVRRSVSTDLGLPQLTPSARQPSPRRHASPRRQGSPMRRAGSGASASQARLTPGSTQRGGTAPGMAPSPALQGSTQTSALPDLTQDAAPEGAAQDTASQQAQQQPGSASRAVAGLTSGVTGLWRMASRVRPLGRS